MNKAREKKLVYILNYVSADDTQHFVHVLNLLDKLRELGWSIVLLSEKGGKGVQEVLGQEVKYMSESSRVMRLVRLVTTLAVLRTQGYRLVFVRISKPAALISAIFGKVFGYTSLFWLSGTVLDFDTNKTVLRRIWDAVILKIIVRSVNHFVTGPETMIEYYKAAFRLPSWKIIMLYNDIDLERFVPSSNSNQKQNQVNVLLLHRLSPVRETNKYFHYIVESLGTISTNGTRVILDVVGNGPERTSLEKVAQAAPPNLKIIFHGEIPNRKVRDFYSNADIFIMPSYREGFPRVTIEAMAMGLPIVSTDAGGTRDLLGPLQLKFVVSRDEPAAFAERLARLVQDREMRRKLSEENLKYVQRFSTENVARMYDEKLSVLLL